MSDELKPCPFGCGCKIVKFQDEPPRYRHTSYIDIEKLHITSCPLGGFEFGVDDIPVWNRRADQSELRRKVVEEYIGQIELYAAYRAEDYEVEEMHTDYVLGLQRGAKEAIRIGRALATKEK